MKYLFTISLLLMLSTQVSYADLIGDTVNAEASHPVLGNLINGSAVVGSGIEFAGAGGPLNYTLDIDANSFTLTVSKEVVAGNFTGILSRLELTGIDGEIIGVTADGNGSVFDEAVLPVLSFTENSILVVPESAFLSANDSGDDFTREFTWNVEFASATAVPEPSGASLLLAMVTFLTLRRSKAQK